MTGRQKIKKTVIFTNYQCNNRCIFCMEYEKRKMPPKSTAQIMMEMDGARGRGTTYIEFIGGEFTIRRDALEILRYAKESGFDTIMIATNGRMLSYKPYAQELIEAGLNSVVFSIHGHTAELHDHLTQSPGSFRQLMAGLENFRSLGFEKMGSNTTIVNDNLKQLPEIGSFIASLGLQNSEFIFVDPNYGGAQIRFKELVPHISDAASYIRACLDVGRNKRIPHWHVRYVPLCYFSDYLDSISELEEVKKFSTEHLAPDFTNLEVEATRPLTGRAKPEKCRLCRLYDQCEGIWIEYLRQYGDEELHPVTI